MSIGHGGRALEDVVTVDALPNVTVVSDSGGSDEERPREAGVEVGMERSERVYSMIEVGQNLFARRTQGGVAGRMYTLMSEGHIVIFQSARTAEQHQMIISNCSTS